MPIITQLFSEIISNPPVINSGVGGWDALLNQFLADRRGRHGFGLLSRNIGLTNIPTGSTGTVLILCPPGWKCMPLFVVVFASQDPNGTMDFTIDSATGGDKMWAANVNLSGSQTTLPWDQLPFVVFPNPGAGDNFFADSEQPQQVPVISGDDPGNSDTFRVNRDGAADITYDFFVYGFAWPTQD